MKITRCLISFLLITAIAISALPVFAQDVPVQKEIYVSCNAGENGNGSINAPFKTIEEAQNYVRSISANMTGDIVVYLREGTYRIDKTLEFINSDGGSNGFYVRYEGYKDEEVVISGGVEVKGWKESTTPGVWEAPFDAGVDYVLNMDINRRPGRRASGEERGLILEPWNDTEDEKFKCDGFYVDAEEFPADYKNLEDIQLRVTYMWRNYLFHVKEITPAEDKPGKNLVKIRNLTKQISDEQFLTQKSGDIIGLSFIIENAYEELDTPGEFYYDNEKRIIYYIPRSGEDMNTALVEVAVAEKLMDLKGNSSLDKLKNLAFRNISFMHSTWQNQLKYGFLTGQTQSFYVDPEMMYQEKEHVGKFFVPASVWLNYTDGVIFENNTFRQIGSVGIGLYQGAYNTRIVGNLFYEMGDSAVTVGTPEQAAESPVIDGCNLAEGKPVSESGLPFGVPQRWMGKAYFGPEAAVVPDEMVGWYSRDVTLGLPYLQIDLLDEYEIDRIEITARQDTDQAPARRNFRLLASNDPEFKTYVLLGSQGSTPFEHKGTRVWEVTDSNKYRYVRAEKTVKELFWINEIKVINESMEFCPVIQLSRHTTISDNYITRVAEYNWGAPGVHGYFTENLNISHNDISDVPYSGICSGWGWNNYLDMTICRDIRINYNKIHDAMQLCLDGGGIYTLGRQPNSTEIGNHIYNMWNPLGGFYTDTGTSYFTFRDNVIENTSFAYNTGGPTYSIGNLVTNNFTTSMDGKLVNMRGEALNGRTDSPIYYVPFNYPEEVIDIIENSGVREKYRDRKKEIPEEMFPITAEDIFDNMIHVTNHGSMNDDRYINWMLKGPITNITNLIAMAKQEMEAGVSKYSEAKIKETENAIEEAKKAILVRPIDRKALTKHIFGIRNAIMDLGKSRELKNFDELLTLCDNELKNTTIGTGYGQTSKEAFDTLKSSVEIAKKNYNTDDEERKYLANLRLDKAYAKFLDSKVDLNIRSITFGDAQIAEPVVDYENHTINVTLKYAAGTLLKPDIKVSDNVNVYPSLKKEVDFTNPVTYTISTSDGKSSTWTVYATREEVTNSHTDNLNKVINDDLGWMSVGTRSKMYLSNLFGEYTYNFNMSVETKHPGDWPAITFRNKEANKEFTEKGTAAYVLIFSEGKLEFHRFNDGVRTQFYGPVASVPAILGTSKPCDEFVYGKPNKISIVTRNEAGGVRIILNVNGKEVMNVLDNYEGAITDPGYFGTVSPNIPVVLSPVE